MKQRTIKKKVSISGIGIHTGIGTGTDTSPGAVFWDAA